MGFCETILFMAYYLFAFVYTSRALGIYEEEKNWNRILILLLSMTIGIIYFPGIFAEDVYSKLNKK